MKVFIKNKPGPEVIKLSSCASKLNITLKLLINDKIAQINGNFRFRSTQPVIYPAGNCWHFNIYEQDKF